MHRIMNLTRPVLLALLILAIGCLAIAADVTGKPVTYSTDKKSVQYVVIDLAKQVGLGYNWDKSFSQTDPECRQWVTGVSITDQPFDKAMASILDPVNLRYKVEDDQIVLYRK